MAKKNLALCYCKDNEAFTDYEKAKLILEELAFGQSDGEAYGYLSRLYRDGKGVQVDFNKAYEYCEKGAGLGNSWCKDELEKYTKSQLEMAGEHKE